MSTTLTKPLPKPACGCPEAAVSPRAGGAQVALVGNPNAGKTTLFNALTGIRAKTANFPGTTIEIRRGPLRGGGSAIEMIDLPGLYSLQAAAAEERLALDKLFGRIPGHGGPQALVLLIDATNLTRNLFLASQVLEMGLPTVIALTMMDVAEGRGMAIDIESLSRDLGCGVIATTARTGRGIGNLAATIRELADGRHAVQARPVGLPRCTGEDEHLRFEWAEAVARRCLTAPGRDSRAAMEAVDRYLTHPVWGFIGYLAVMLVLFYLIFAVAQAPMGWIDAGVGALGDLGMRWLPAGDLRSLLTKGVINGVGGVLIFLPQICLVFFCLSLLEDVGYMARAALVMDRLMRRVGLPGKAFVPMLSAHACAVPAIMSTRMIEDKRDRLVTILILPLLTCSARLPVYAMVAALLFQNDPLKATLMFVGAYGLGLGSAVLMALVFRRTILPGTTQPLVIELPDYRRPSLKLALMTTLDRARIFLAKAGTVILAVSVVLWWLSSYPRLAPGDLPPQTRAEIARLNGRADALAAAGRPDQAETLRTEAVNTYQQQELANSFIGRIGHWIEPVIHPLGFDWRIGVGVFSSFAAREVIVSTLSILYGLGDAGTDSGGTLYDRMRTATWPDGRPVFNTATCMSLLVFFVLAMQCMSTLAVTRRETGQWRWVFLQQGYMTALAYGAALVTYQTLAAMGLS